METPAHIARHGIDHLANVVVTEITVHTDRTLAIPLVIHNPSNSAIDVNFSVKAPEGWKILPVARASVAAHGDFYSRVLAVAPSTKLPGWQEFTITATSAGKNLGTVPIRAELSSGWVAPQ